MDYHDGQPERLVDPVPDRLTLSKIVSQCCKAPIFKEGERSVCEACRLTAKLIAIPG